jgi:hypothetical protein
VGDVAKYDKLLGAGMRWPRGGALVYGAPNAGAECQNFVVGDVATYVTLRRLDPVEEMRRTWKRAGAVAKGAWVDRPRNAGIQRRDFGGSPGCRGEGDRVIAAGEGTSSIRGAGSAPSWHTYGPLGVDPPRVSLFSKGPVRRSCLDTLKA